eukprot:GHRQ01031167.1.p1 GENE.GHRQ01031167.1~~GHRQ01031167.1.p1  ORF type:complete len:161 (-),score=44.62 GHRQ01031167.1:453-935(-)
MKMFPVTPVAGRCLCSTPRTLMHWRMSCKLCSTRTVSLGHVLARRPRSYCLTIVSCCTLTLVRVLSVLQDSIIFGADTIATAEDRAAEVAAGATPLGIGDGTQLRRAIVDSNARIGPNCVLTNTAGVVDGSSSSLPKGIVIKDGILVVMRGAVIPAGTKV